MEINNNTKKMYNVLCKFENSALRKLPKILIFDIKSLLDWNFSFFLLCFPTISLQFPQDISVESFHSIKCCCGRRESVEHFMLQRNFYFFLAIEFLPEMVVKLEIVLRRIAETNSMDQFKSCRRWSHMSLSHRDESTKLQFSDFPLMGSG